MKRFFSGWVVSKFKKVKSVLMEMAKMVAQTNAGITEVYALIVIV